MFKRTKKYYSNKCIAENPPAARLTVSCESNASVLLSTMRFTAILVLTILFSASATLGQTRIITGKTLDDHLYPLGYIEITNLDTTVLATTDPNGNFKVEIPIGTKSLRVIGIRKEWKLINLSPDCNYLEIIVLNAGSYDFMSPRKVDRLRKKYFNTLPQLHMDAYNKGIFKMTTRCYEDIFLPMKEKLKEIHKNRTTRHPLNNRSILAITSDANLTPISN